MQKDDEKIVLVGVKSAKNQPHTQVGELRDLLTTIEKRIAKLKEISPEDALGILPLLDQAKERLDALESVGRSASSEASQFESLLLQLNNKGAIFLNRVGGLTALRQARMEHMPDESHWWWFIDESLSQKRKSKVKRWAIVAASAGALLIVLVILYNQFLAPDPAFQAGVGFQQSAENNLLQGRYEEALADVDQAIERLPDYPELYVIRGVIYEMLEEPDWAEQNYQLAREMENNEENFYNQRAKYYLMANLAERSIADAEIALSIKPDSAVSMLYLGQAYEVSGDIPTAIEYYEAASEAAERSNDVQLQVIARMNLAQAMQNIAVPNTATPAE